MARRSSITKKSRSKTKQTPTQAKPMPVLTSLNIFKTYLTCNKEFKFRIYLPWDSPIECMMRQLTTEGWQVNQQGAYGTIDGGDLLLPKWAQEYQKILSEYQSKVITDKKVAKQQRGYRTSPVITGATALAMLNEMLDKKK